MKIVAVTIVSWVLGFLAYLAAGWVTVWSNNIGRALLSPEAALFYFMFGIFGAVFGAGFFLGYGHRSA